MALGFEFELGFGVQGLGIGIRVSGLNTKMAKWNNGFSVSENNVCGLWLWWGDLNVLPRWPLFVSICIYSK